MVTDLAKYIDHTLLKPEASEAQVRRLCLEALEHGFVAVCVHPCWVRLCAGLLQGSPAAVCSVAGFPLGANLGGIKALEAQYAVSDGAREIDMVINLGWLKSGRDAAVREEILRVAEPVHAAGARLKVIIEAALLSQEEKVRACTLAVEAGADFVKTSTGFGPGGASAADVALMRGIVGREVGVKAAGGIRDYATAQLMIEAGANRIGTSSGVQIMREAEGQPLGPPARSAGE